jgi:sugar lactone lactonase YvrE
MYCSSIREILKKNIMKKITILFTILCFTFLNQTQAQFASYSFDTDASDAINGYYPNTYGDANYISDGDHSVIELEGDEFLNFPSEMSSNINSQEEFMYNIRFKIVDNYTTNPYNGETVDEGRRVLVSNKYDSRPALGFDLHYGDWGGYQLMATYGDNKSEGQLDWITPLEIGVWYDVTVKMFFNVPKPYIQYTINGNVSISFFSDSHVDLETFKSSLDNQSIWVGTDKYNTMSNGETGVYAKVNIDKLSFYDAVPPGDPAIINMVLTSFTNHMNGTISLSNAEREDLYSDFIDNWDEGSYAPNEDIVTSYLAVYNSQNGAIFDSELKIKVSDMFIEQRIQYTLQQWIIDNLYTTSNTSSMVGVTFSDHVVFPGAVDSSAPRASDVSFNVDGFYKTDPGFTLNDQGSVIRPTGYYAAPGELVTLTLPSNTVNQGVKIRVGAHLGDLEVTWSEFSRFPRIYTTYDVTSTSLVVANPFGGAIYIILPDGSDFGTMTCQVSGAVKSPYYSNKPGFERSLSEYQVDLANNYVKWVDWESPKFMTTFPAPAATTVDNPDDVITLWDKTFDSFNTHLGRPLERFRAEYILIDCQNNYAGTAAPAANPMPLEVTGANLFNATPTMTPINVINGDAFMTGDGSTLGTTHHVILHEYGHLHNPPTLHEEHETIVNLPAVAVYNQVFGQSMEDALRYSNQQRLNFDEAALDWILSPPFRSGERMEIDLVNYDNYLDGRQLAYQTRGHAKYADIAKLYSWEKLGEINGYFYQERIINPFANNSYQDDIYISAASEKMNINMAPLFDFWGVLASDNLVSKLETRPTDDKIKERLLHYRSIVPADNAAFQVVYDNMTPKLEPHHDIRYNNMLSNYDESVAASILARIDAILCKYYNVNCVAENNDGSPIVTFALSSNTIDEDSATDVILTATLDVLSSETVTIDFDLSGTAVQTTDYTVSSLSITIAPGLQSGAISISTNGLDDDQIEVLQTIILTPTVTNATTTADFVSLNLLSDDNPRVTSITNTETSIEENGGISVITATLDAPASKPTHIILDVTGNAGHKVDYATDYSSKGEYTISTVAGGNGAGAANDQFNFASGLYVDTSGNVYVADLLNHRVQKWARGATSGITVAGGNGAGIAANQLNKPHGIFVDSSGNLYIADSKNHRIQKWESGATQGTTVAGGNGIGVASHDIDLFDRLNNPQGVFVSDDGDVYVADTGNNRIQKWTPGATSGIRVAGGGEFGVNHNLLAHPNNVFVTPARDIYVADSENSRIQKWREGSVDILNATGWNEEGSDVDQLNFSIGVFVDPLENMYIADYYNHRIQKWKVVESSTLHLDELFVDGDAITVAGDQGQGDAINQFNGPKAIFVDVLGDLYVADMKNHRIQKYHYGPRITIPAGETTGNLTITALEDTSDDDDEKIVITPISVINAISDHTNAHNITIVDDDATPVVSFEWSAENIEENSAKDVALVAKLSNTSNKEIIINFSVSGTANQTTEYILSETSINIPAGVSSRDLTVSTKGLDDDEIEIKETIILTVSSGLTNAITASDSTTLNLLSKDAPTVTSIIVDDTNIEENGGVSIVTATISAPTSVPTRIELDVYGTATFIDDYVVDFSSKGEPFTVAGSVQDISTGSAGSNQFNEPAGLFVDTQDNLYVADQFNQRVQKWGSGAVNGVTVAGTEEMGATPNAFVEPRGISVSADGFVYVADSKNHRVQKWRSGEFSGITVAGGNEEGESSDQLNNPIGLHVDLSGNVYVADTYNHRIQKWTPGATSGITVAGGNGQGAAANQLDNPYGVYADDSGNVYVADTENHRVQKWEPDASQGTTIAGGNGQGAAANQLSHPEDLFIDAFGGIYIADTYNARVQKKEDGDTVWNTIGVESLSQARNVYVSAKMNVYVTDRYNNRIEKYQYFPEITILPGETTGKLTITALDDTSSASKGVYSRKNSSDDGDESIVITPVAVSNSILSTEASETTINITISDGSSLGIEDVVINDADTILAYPNPSDGIFEIAVPISEKEVSIVIYNIYGQLISKRTYPVSYGKVNLDIKNQPIGIYLAKVYLEVPATLKIIKK